MSKNLQVGERVSVKSGSNLTEDFVKVQDIRTEIEKIEEFVRVVAILQQHKDGKRSALEVSYNEIVRNPSVLDNVTPIARDLTGDYVLWEGYKTRAKSIFESNRGDRGPLHRVIQHANGGRTFCRYNSVTKDWIVCTAKDEDGNKIYNRFPENVVRIAKSENWQDVGERTVARSVMNRSGDVVRRTF